MIARIVTCPARAASCAATIEQLARSDWGRAPIIHVDAGPPATRMDRINANWRVALEAAAGDDAAALMLEDDVLVNAHIRHNLEHWEPIGRSFLLGFLYNGANPRRLSAGSAFFLTDPFTLWGAQGIVVSPAMAAHILARWNDEGGCADTRMPRIAARLGPVYCHSPSLVQHIGVASTWGGPFHQTADFDPDWRAP